MRGQALVETALVMPLLMALFLGIVSFSFLALAYADFTEATSQAAQWWAENPDQTPAQVQQQAVADAPWPGLETSQVQVVPADSQPAAGQWVTVRVVYPVGDLPGIGPILKNLFHVGATLRVSSTYLAQ